MILEGLVILKSFLGKEFYVDGEGVRHPTYLTEVSHMTLILNITSQIKQILIVKNECVLRNN